MPESGSDINGIGYSKHALERMAPDTPYVRAKLSRRVEKFAAEKGKQIGTMDYYNDYKKYIDPRNVPPSVVEDAIKNTTAVIGTHDGTFYYETIDVKVIVNSSGKVVTFIPK